MADTKQFLLGAFIVLFGLFAYPSVQTADIALFESTHTHINSFPYDNDWGLNGTHDNTESVDGVLQVNDTSNPPGIYTSDKFSDAEEIAIESFAVDTVLNGHSGTLELRVEDENGVIEETQEYDLRDGLHSYDLGNFSDVEHSKYQFVYTLQAGGGTSAEIHGTDVEVTAWHRTSSDYPAIIVLVVLAFAGIWAMVDSVV